MVPKLHAKGKSFAGAARYVLHDKGRASTAERVEWADTLNLATDNPDTAWRVMAATAMDQDRLKAQAGVKNTGRKSKDSVLHLTLSWHPDESDGVTPEEMRRAALGALSAIGARDRQALLVCHNDEPQAHLHIIVNRVSPDDGRMLSSSKEKLKLSEWAEAYEKERGKVYCEDRVINNEARKRGEYTRGEKDQARNVYEAQARNDNFSDEAKAKQAAKDAQLAKKSRELQERHKREAQKLEDGHKSRAAKIAADTKAAIFREIKAVRDAYRKPRTELHREHDAQLVHFEKREETLLGKVQNAYKALDLPARVGRKAEIDEGPVVGSVFGVLSSKGARKAALKAQQERETRELNRKQRLDEQKATQRHRDTQAAKLQKNRERFKAERAEYMLKKAMDLAKMRAEWRERNTQRKEVFKGDGGRVPEVAKKASPELSAEEAARLASTAQSAAELSKIKRNRDRSIERDEGQER